jgi:hypothetical protein
MNFVVVDFFQNAFGVQEAVILRAKFGGLHE